MLAVNCVLVSPLVGLQLTVNAGALVVDDNAVDQLPNLPDVVVPEISDVIAWLDDLAQK